MSWSIQVHNLSKRYYIRPNVPPLPYRTLRDEISRAASVTHRWMRGDRPTSEAFWALKDVSFEVKEGDIVGVIGPNGAGKSTLLKILSRITRPTHGYARIRGRIGSLLEVGTGFHPELTGRENIYLSGAVAGMRRHEIRRHFNDIVDFAETEQFLDTPAKRYSTGMYVRLAFAVAAHLEPEVLLLDEVLSVGDADFQGKCADKLRELASAGRTIIFVSHQMAAVRHFCSHCLLLRNGELASLGPTPTVVNEYLSRSQHGGPQLDLNNRQDRRGTGAIRFSAVAFVNHTQGMATPCSGDNVIVRLYLTNSVQQPDVPFHISIGIDDPHNNRIAHLSTECGAVGERRIDASVRFVDVMLPRLPLAPGRYYLTLYATVNGQLADWIKQAVTMHVDGGDFYGTGNLPTDGQGAMLLDHSFSLGRIL